MLFNSSNLRPFLNKNRWILRLVGLLFLTFYPLVILYILIIDNLEIFKEVWEFILDCLE